MKALPDLHQMLGLPTQVRGLVSRTNLHSEMIHQRQRRIQWKPVSEFTLRDDSSEEDLIKVESCGHRKSGEEEEEENLIEDVVLGLQAIREKPVKVLLDAERLKWLSVTWPSTLAKTFKRCRDMAKIKTKLTIDAF